MSEKDSSFIASSTENDDKEPDNQLKDPKVAVFDFFKLKNEYKKNTILFKKLKKRLNRRPKCVNCNRLVGTNFTIKNNQYAAVCGDKTSPCKLNILITREPIELYKDTIDLFRKDIIEEKQKIIQNKLDVIFGYITENEALKKSETLLDNYNTDVMAFTDYNEVYKNIIMSEERAKDIQKIQNDIEEHIREIQYLCDPTNINKKIATEVPLEEIVQVYLHDLLPKIEKIRNLKYPVLEIDNQKYYKYDFLPEKEFITIKDTVVKWTVGP